MSKSILFHMFAGIPDSILLSCKKEMREQRQP